MFEELIPGNMKTAMKNGGATAANMWAVPIDEIHVIEGFNVRIENDEYQAHVRWIADSIKANGFHRDKPLTGYVSRNGDANVINITDGHSRLAAAKLANSEGAEITALPVVVKPHGTSVEDLIVGLVVGNSGRPLAPLEVGEVCKRLVGFGMAPAEIAKRISMSPNYVSKLLALVAAPREVRKMVESGKVSATLAMETIAKKPEKAATVLREAIAAGAVNGKKKITKKALVSKSIVIKGTVSEFAWSRLDSGEEDEEHQTVTITIPKTEGLVLGQSVRLSIKTEEDEL